MERNLFQTKRAGPIILSTLAYCLHILIPSSAARRLGQLGTEDRGQHKHGHQQLISLKPASINILASWNRQVHHLRSHKHYWGCRAYTYMLAGHHPELKCKCCRVRPTALEGRIMLPLRSQPSGCRSQRRCGRLPWIYRPISWVTGVLIIRLRNRSFAFIAYFTFAIGRIIPKQACSMMNRVFVCLGEKIL